MPIYEYECRACGHRFEQLILHANTPECPSCQSHDLERLISLFAVDSEGTRGLASDAGRRRSGQDRAIGTTPKSRITRNTTIIRDKPEV